MHILNLSDDLMTFGRDEDGGLACSGSVQLSSNRPQAIASLANVTSTATVTMAVTHSYRAGQTVTVRGATDANFNGTFTIVSAPTPLTFTYTMAGTPSVTTLTGLQSQTQLSDTTKNWRVNQWANHVVYITTSTMTAASGLVSGQNLRILSNTANTLTFVTPAGTAPINGVTRYIITKNDMIGAMYNGFATGSAPSATTLQDTNVNFLGSGSIAGNVLTVTLNSFVTGSLGIGSVVTGSFITPGTFITAFGPNTFQSSSIGTYLVNYSQSAALGQISSSGWLTNFFAGRRVKILTGTGQGQESTIASNTNNTLTFSSITTVPGLVSSSYAILQQPIRGTGIEAQWVQGNSDPNLRGRRIYIARGGGVNNFDYVDIPTDKVEVLSTSPQPETLTTGTMYAYDGGDRIYFTKDTTMRFYYLDVTTNQIHGAGLAPFGNAGAATIGNRMEVFTTPDGLKYLWMVKHTNINVMRTMLYY